MSRGLLAMMLGLEPGFPNDRNIPHFPERQLDLICWSISWLRSLCGQDGLNVQPAYTSQRKINFVPLQGAELNIQQIMRGILSVLSLTAWSLVSLVGITSAAGAGNVTFNGSNRLLFDVDGNHISAYALKIYCKYLVSQSHQSSHD